MIVISRHNFRYKYFTHVVNYQLLGRSIKRKGLKRKPENVTCCCCVVKPKWGELGSLKNAAFNLKLFFCTFRALSDLGCQAGEGADWLTLLLSSSSLVLSRRGLWLLCDDSEPDGRSTLVDSR